MAQRTVLTYKGHIFEETFGRYRDRFLWNHAFYCEYYHWKTGHMSKSDRTWYGDVAKEGVEKLKALGWGIEPAYVKIFIKRAAAPVDDTPG